MKTRFFNIRPFRKSLYLEINSQAYGKGNFSYEREDDGSILFWMGKFHLCISHGYG